MQRICGNIHLEKETPSFSDATLYVYLENETYADADSMIMATYKTTGVRYHSKIRNSFPFEIVCKDINPSDRYAIRVHIDIDRDGKVSRGDFINKQSYPVITFGYPNEISIIVHQIN
ncbi:MAG TPA: YbaY family lipoprotein [Niabella sp.]|nr:YbaY family lipoprotein [Niabella sp.]HQW15124.1 YbaY family lipoprotein [Niabella sp.]HQX20265.1 YbaY family lipoprotein [Niabella sp.]HQX41584.1 YbaY family lipoprotein [Niabella sp.]HRB07386.1 YbaY family lipoprotein [Niabella sp.]